MKKSQKERIEQGIITVLIFLIIVLIYGTVGKMEINDIDQQSAKTYNVE